MRFKVVIILVILMLASVLFITGCHDSNYENIDDEHDYSRRLKIIEQYPLDYTIAYDSETGVCYLFGSHCLTVMVDEEGKPLLYDESEFQY